MSRTKARGPGPAQKEKREQQKRKRDEESNETGHTSKQRKTERPEQTVFDESISKMDPSLIADHFAQALKRHLSESSTIELEDKYIPSKAVRDTTTFSKPHVANNLPQFLEEYCGGKEALSSSQDTASPHTLVITASGIRAADIAREVRVFGTEENKIGKLFAKHMKLKDQVEFLQNNKVGIAVGTPVRPLELIKREELKLQALKRIVIDGSYIDDKKRTIFGLKEVFLPMVELLNCEPIVSRLIGDENKIEILVF